jgi:hypothetical protein
MTLGTFIAFSSWFLYGLWFLFLLIVADLLFGILLAIKTKQFKWSKVGDFLLSTVLPYLVGWVVVDLMVNTAAMLLPSLPFLPAEVAVYFGEGISVVVYIGAVMAVFVSLKDNFAGVFGLIPPMPVGPPTAPYPGRR